MGLHALLQGIALSFFNVAGNRNFPVVVSECLPYGMKEYVMISGHDRQMDMTSIPCFFYTL
jgi:hypothetical protein